MDQKALLNKVKMVRVRLEGVLKPELYQEIVEIEKALESEIKPKGKQKETNTLFNEQKAAAIARRNLFFEKKMQKAREEEGNMKGNDKPAY